MAKIKIKEIVADISEEFLKKQGLELYHVEFVKEGKDWFLRVYIDKDSETEAYVSTDDCELVSRFLSEKLDEADPIEQNYYLEVSSPGMDRTLFSERHYEKYKGREVEVSLYQSIEGEKMLTGKLLGLSEGKLKIIRNSDSKEWEIDIDKVSKTRLAVIF